MTTHYILNRITKSKKLKFLLLATIPTAIVLLFFSQYIFTGNNLRMGDFDYYAQMYEAFRISVLKYGQFPDNNPWMSGGIPLYANPQFGLISIQSILVLFFGSIYGLKLAYVLYAIAGYWGMYFVSRHIAHADRTKSLLLAFIWVACGFFAGHNISHFTFALFFLFPWLFYLIHNWRRPYYWLYGGVLLSLIALSSFHYAFLMSAAAIGLYLVLTLASDIARLRHTSANKQRANIIQYALFCIKFGSIFIILVAHKLFATYSYISQNERLVNNPEKYPSVATALHAIFLPTPWPFSVPNDLQWGWGEYSMYIGVGTGIAICLLTVSILHSRYISHSHSKSLNLSRTEIILLSIMALVIFTLSLGKFMPFSPYGILHHLPGFTQTRVPGRWLIFVVFLLLVYIASFRGYRRTLWLLLSVACMELMVSYGPFSVNGSDMVHLPTPHSLNSVMVQHDNGRKRDISKDSYDSYTYTTEMNIGQIYSDDSIINTLDGVYNTKRCDTEVSSPCGLVMSGNAIVRYWSPNKIVLERTAAGQISLNVNPYYAWRVNGARTFASLQRLDPDSVFTVADPSKVIILEYKPKYKFSSIMEKIRSLF